MTRWDEDRAERHLRSLELFGMRFGLEKMRRMMTALEAPQRRFDSIHIVGTNGKTSTARMTAAILERHGVRTGTYTSPHLVSYRERIQVGERELDGARFAAAVARAARVATEHGARLLQAEEEDLPQLGAEGDFQRRNFALARAATQAFLERAGIEAHANGIAAAAATTQVPGRMQVVAQEPLTLLDA